MPEVTAPFVLLNDTPQASDVALSEGPHQVFQRYARVKQYVKYSSLDINASPRQWDFDQPFQWVTDKVGGTWKENNNVYVVQMAGCNLACPYCFALKEGRTAQLTPREVLDDYLANRKEQSSIGRCLRISGGEPFLHQNWLAEFVADNCRVVYPEHCLWIDTNLTIPPGEKLLGMFSAYMNISAAVCGCFKPGQAPLDEQLSVVRKLLGGAVRDLFLYFPADLSQSGNGKRALLDTLEGLYSIHYHLPLRLTVIRLKWEYQQTQANGGMCLDQGLSDAYFQSLRRVYFTWLEKHYPKERLWLPSHQAKLERG